VFDRWDNRASGVYVSDSSQRGRSALNSERRPCPIREFGSWAAQISVCCKPTVLAGLSVYRLFWADQTFEPAEDVGGPCVVKTAWPTLRVR
jgi:hypothetical protein